ncbi:MAG: hypothetical protein JJD98_10380 [Polaromonas sp.]|nr:hypothetical protein [Polaromonas sp.]
MVAAQQYIGQATFVASFAVDRLIRYKVEEIERAFQGVFTAQAVSTNVPDTGPSSIPRFTLQSGPKQISVSQVTAQLDLNFNEQRKSISNTFLIIEKNFGAFWNGVCQLKKLDEIKNAGLVLTINTPSQQTREEICARILERYAKIPIRGTPANASIQFGFLDEAAHLFNNVSLQHYEVRSGTFTSEKPGTTAIEIDIQTIPVREQGYETKVDINSRPMEAAKVGTTINLGEVLLGSVKTFITGWGEEFFAWQ